MNKKYFFFDVDGTLTVSDPSTQKTVVPESTRQALKQLKENGHFVSIATGRAHWMTREVARLIHAMGGNELSAYGLCHLGDYEATLFSPHSHNRMFGECFIKGQPYTQLAEGASTVKALIRLGQEYGVDLPICHVVDSVLYHNMQPDQALNSLFSRSVKGEFDL